MKYLHCVDFFEKERHQLFFSSRLSRLWCIFHYSHSNFLGALFDLLMKLMDVSKTKVRLVSTLSTKDLDFNLFSVLAYVQRKFQHINWNPMIFNVLKCSKTIFCNERNDILKWELFSFAFQIQNKNKYCWFQLYLFYSLGYWFGIKVFKLCINMTFQFYLDHAFTHQRSLLRITWFFVNIMRDMNAHE